MSKNVKILIATGVFFDVESNNVRHDLRWFIGYFTNLKELYKHFDKTTTQSYSTICQHLKRQEYYISKNPLFYYGDKYKRFNEIRIREVKTNTLYEGHKVVSLNDLLAKEVTTVDVQVGMNLASSD